MELVLAFAVGVAVGLFLGKWFAGRKGDNPSTQRGGGNGEE